MAARLSFILIVLAAGCTEAKMPPVTKHRVISLSPAATSVVIALGAQDQLAGISTFCPEVPNHPDLPRLGGLIDPNLEAIALLQPSLVVLTSGGKATAHRLQQLGIDSLQLAEGDLGGVIDNYRVLGAALNRPEASIRLRTELENLFAKQPQKRGKRTLLVFAHEGERYWVATPKGWLGQLAQRMGLRVVPPGQKGFQALSAEAIVDLAPEQILELRGQAPGGASLSDLRARWARFPSLAQLKDIHLIEDEELLQPGASLFRTAQALLPFGGKP
ncbi:MAG: hypothetical protein CMH55_02615 [Myxococcales bacterium]|nr:hypothetical protein [Myxococcales bacterium]